MSRPLTASQVKWIHTINGADIPYSRPLPSSIEIVLWKHRLLVVPDLNFFDKQGDIGLFSDALTS